MHCPSLHCTGYCKTKHPELFWCMLQCRVLLFFAMCLHVVLVQSLQQQFLVVKDFDEEIFLAAVMTSIITADRIHCCVSMAGSVSPLGFLACSPSPFLYTQWLWSIMSVPKAKQVSLASIIGHCFFTYYPLQPWPPHNLPRRRQWERKES